jgi:hypothetical protein
MQSDDAMKNEQFYENELRAAVQHETDIEEKSATGATDLSQYTYSDCHLLDPSADYGVGFSWVFSRHTVYLRLGEYARINGKLRPNPIKPAAVLHKKDVLNLKNAVRNNLIIIIIINNYIKFF